ncbi:MAG TPA: C40 family peptidase [Beutenbergiaceae bacterium]|nr:C40 family peptidase [Beutenbergiaceae bacterium]
MSQSKAAGRYRADRRPVTPLTTLNQFVTGSAGRRAAAAAASTGIIFTMTAAGSVASPTSELTAATPGAGMKPLDANDSIATSPTVTVDKDVSWSFVSADQGTSAEAPPPEPAPTVTQTPEREQTPSRSGERQPVQEESQEEASSAPATATGSAIVAEARKYVGTPYVHGGASPGGFDCSGFTSYVFGKFGVSLPRSSGAQRGAGRVVSAAEARPGDLVWWPGHVGIYTGNGNHIAARNPSSPLHESKLHRAGATYIRVID